MKEKEKIERLVTDNFKINTEEFKKLSPEERERKKLIAENTIKMFIKHNELFEELAK
ncbi:hypothetical protein [Fusobacterium russii]|uniref:hypothetical protein n=1 Tax=Fusobacterium russii TaxID=854 RepID=UPI0003A9D205|nr:hypothetical protein [Fusobacterium russii]